MSRSTTLRPLAACLSWITVLACGPTPQQDAGPSLTPRVVVTGPHSVDQGDTLTLSAETIDGEDDAYTWVSSNLAVATVTSTGVVTGTAPGEVTLTVTGADTLASATHVVVVLAGIDPPAPSVVVMGDHRVSVGETLTLTATTIHGTDASYTWTSSSPSLATIDDGVVTALAPGELSITATGTNTGASGTFALVTVEVPIVPVASVTVSGPFYVDVGGTAQLSATTLNATDTGHTWSSSDEVVATVSPAGLVTAMQPGSVTITAVGIESGATGALGLVVAQDIPSFDKWQSSGHADASAAAFTYWNSTGEIPVDCARCHSSTGYRDYVGADGSAFGVVDAPAPTGTTVDCVACHNDATDALSSVTFPSGATLTGLGAEARCMTCHQGRASSAQVDDAIATAGVGDDEVSSALGFVNIHYYAAGATLNAGRVKGGYQYAGEVYDTRFRHVPDRDVCIECHDQHSLEVRVNACQQCHTDVSDVEDLKNVRMMSSRSTDYNGNGDLVEGIYGEMTGLRDDVLFGRIRAYADDKLSLDICYSEAAYPYWFVDTDGSGPACDASEAVFPNRFQSWTPRLLRAAYNFQVAKKDPGAFAHNAKYVIQLLFDAAHDLNDALAAPIDLSALERDDPGHWNGAGKAARNWDNNDGVSASCSKCHGGSEGFRFYLTYGVGKKVLEQSDGIDCATCHETFGDEDLPGSYSVIDIDSVLFPSGLTVSKPNEKSNLCMTCHQGRESTVSVDAAIAAGGNQVKFKNIHYLPAAAVKMGSQAKGGYEFDGESYAAEWTTHPGGSACTDCHSPENTDHTFRIDDNMARCTMCHVTIVDVTDIRAVARQGVDYDGDGDAAEALDEEISTLAELLLEEMNASAGLCYDENTYPYWFQDDDLSGGACSVGENVSSNQFAAWTPELVRTTFNYQLSQKEKGAWAHNFDYITALLIDSIAHLGGDVGSMVRP